METPLVVALALLALGIGTVALFVWRAPAGYQDDRGFHLGNRGDADSGADLK